MRKTFCAILSAFLCVFALSLPAFAEGTALPAEIVLSAPSGFYADSLTLTVSCTDPRAHIVYTTDCSMPSPDSAPYVEPLVLKDASLNPNFYSSRTDTSVMFNYALLNQHQIYDHYVYEPIGLVDKCHVLRFAAYLPDGTLIAETQGVYFIGFDGKTAYKDIYVCSITAEPDDLYSYENGIYVNGVTMDELVEKDHSTPFLNYLYWALWDANYHWHGELGSRRCSFELFSPERESLIRQDCSIRIFGQASRSFLPKSLELKIDKAQGDKPFETPFFKTSEVNTLRLSAGGQSILWSKPEAVVRQLLPELVMNDEQIPCAVFLEGEYAGFCFITRKVDKDLFYEETGINKKNVLFVKGTEIEEGGRAEKLYTDLLHSLAQLSESDENYLQKVNELLDVENYAEMFAAMIYLGEVDWIEFGNNCAMWRSITAEKDPTGDCRWRLFYYDLNATTFNLYEDSFAYFLDENETPSIIDAFSKPDDDILSLLFSDEKRKEKIKEEYELYENDEIRGFLLNKGKNPLIKRLYENEEFRILLVQKIIELGSDKLSSERCEKIIRDYYSLMGRQIDLQLARYHKSVASASAANREAELLNFFNTRYDYLWSLITNRCGVDWLEKNGLEQYPGSHA